MAPTVTADGFETNMQVNYMAPFVLTNALLAADCLADAARVVNVASLAHEGGALACQIASASIKLIRQCSLRTTFDFSGGTYRQILGLYCRVRAVR